MPRPRLAPLAFIVALLVAAFAVPVVNASEPNAGRPPKPDDRVEAVVAATRAYLGAPYRVGSEGPHAFDCSGLVYRAFADTGQLSLIGGARVRAAGYQRWFAGQGRLSTVEEDAQRGDLVMYGNGAHIGIYLGENRVLSALTSGVTVHSLHGISLGVTGFLRVDWTGARSSPITDRAAIDTLPESPASLVPPAAWIPEVDIRQPAETGRRAREEQLDMRTAATRTFQNADGTYTTEFHARPIHYLGPDTIAWQPIDLRFTALEEGNDAVAHVAASPVNLALRAAGNEAGFLDVSAGDRRIRIGLTGPDRKGRGDALPELSHDGWLADYFDLMSGGVGLRVFARTDGFDSFLVLPRERRSNQFSFVVDAPGLTPVLQPDGTIGLHDEAGEVVGRIPRPLLLDSIDADGSGGAVYPGAAALSLDTDAELPLVTVSVARRYLDEAAYPSYVQLSLVDFAASTDDGEITFVSSSHTDATFEAYRRPETPGYTEVWHGRQPGTRSQNEIYLRFGDVAAMLGAVDLERADLELFPYWQANAAGTTLVSRVAGEWDSASLTWASRPPADAGVGSVETSAGEWSDVDVTDYAAELLAGSQDNGLMLSAESLPGSWKRFVGSGGGDGSGLDPRLSVTWSGSRPAPDPVAVGEAAHFLRWSHAPLAPAQARFQIQVSRDGFATLAAQTGTVKGPLGRGTQWAIPADALPGAGIYSWRVRVKYAGGRDWSPWSAAQTFSFGVTRLETGLLQ